MVALAGVAAGRGVQGEAFGWAVVWKRQGSVVGAGPLREGGCLAPTKRGPPVFSVTCNLTPL